jgi:hypothetical protein
MVPVPGETASPNQELVPRHNDSGTGRCIVIRKHRIPQQRLSWIVNNHQGGRRVRFPRRLVALHEEREFEFQFLKSLERRSSVSGGGSTFKNDQKAAVQKTRSGLEPADALRHARPSYVDRIDHEISIRLSVK